MILLPLSAAAIGDPFPAGGGAAGGELYAPAKRYSDAPGARGYDYFDWTPHPTDVTAYLTDISKTVMGCITGGANEDACVFDTDSDGDDDLVICGDYDGDQVLEIDEGCTDTSTRDGDCEDTLEANMGDLFACLNEITDNTTNQTTIACKDSDGCTMYVLPGRYRVPDSATFSPHAKTSTSSWISGLLPMPSNFHLYCAPGGTVLGGIGPTAHPATESWLEGGTIVVDPAQSNVKIRNCEVDGEWPNAGLPATPEQRNIDCSTDPFSGSDCIEGEDRGGIIIAGSNVELTNTFVHHTGEDCIDIVGATGVKLEGNTQEWCGGVWDLSGEHNKRSGIDIQAQQGNDTEGIEILDNEGHNAGAFYIRTTNAATTVQRIRRVTLDTFYGEDFLYDLDGDGDSAGHAEDGAFTAGFSFEGVLGLTLRNVAFKNTNGMVIRGPVYDGTVSSTPFATDAACTDDTEDTGPWVNGEAVDGLGCSEANANIVIDGLTLEGKRVDGPTGTGCAAHVPCAAGGPDPMTPFTIEEFGDGLDVKRVSLFRNESYVASNIAMLVKGPFRRAKFDDITLREMGQIKLGGTYGCPWGGPSSIGEAVSFNDITIIDPDRNLEDMIRVDAWRWNADVNDCGCTGCTFDGLTARGYTQAFWGIDQQADFQSNSLKNGNVTWDYDDFGGVITQTQAAALNCGFDNADCVGLTDPAACCLSAGMGTCVGHAIAGMKQFLVVDADGLTDTDWGTIGPGTNTSNYVFCGPDVDADPGVIEPSSDSVGECTDNGSCVKQASASDGAAAWGWYDSNDAGKMGATPTVGPTFECDNTGVNCDGNTWENWTIGGRTQQDAISMNGGTDADENNTFINVQCYDPYGAEMGLLTGTSQNNQGMMGPCIDYCANSTCGGGAPAGNSPADNDEASAVGVWCEYERGNTPTKCVDDD